MKTCLAILLSSALPPLAAEGVAIAPPTMGELGGTYGAQIGSNGDGFVAIWRTNYSQVGVAFDRLGRRITPLFGLEGLCASVVPFGNSYLVNCGSRSGQATIFHLGATGLELGTIGSADEETTFRALAATDDRILVSSGAGKLRVIDSGGNAFGEAISVDPADLLYLRAVESTSTGFFLVIEHADSQRMTVTHVSEAGTVSSAFAVPFATAFLAQPVTTIIGENLLIALTDLARGTIFTAAVGSTHVIATHTFPTSRFVPLDLVAAGDGAMLIGGRLPGRRRWRGN